MSYSLADLVWLIIVVAIIYYWWLAKGIKEYALQRTRSHCKNLGLQLLDDSIALRGLWLKTNTQGKLQVWRSYNFDFSSQGDDRYQGRIILLGRAIENIQLAPHRISEP